MDSKNNTAEGYQINPGQSEIVASVLDELSQTPELEKLLEEKGIVLVDSDFIDNYRAYLERLSKNNKALATGLEEIKQERDVLLNSTNYIIQNFAFLEQAIKGAGKYESKKANTSALGMAVKTAVKFLGLKIDADVIYRLLIALKNEHKRLEKSLISYDTHLIPTLELLASHEIIDESILKLFKPTSNEE